MSKQSSSRRLPASRNEVVSDSQTNLQFKLLSAIGIIIIVSGHCYHGGISLAYEWFPTYSFNLALFVFISGYFYKPENERSKYIYIYGSGSSGLSFPRFSGTSPTDYSFC